MLAYKWACLLHMCTSRGRDEWRHWAAHEQGCRHRPSTLRADCFVNRPRIYNLIHIRSPIMADIASTPRQKKRQRRPPLVGETKLFDADPAIYIDTKTAVGMINAQFGAVTSPA